MFEKNGGYFSACLKIADNIHQEHRLPFGPTFFKSKLRNAQSAKRRMVEMLLSLVRQARTSVARSPLTGERLPIVFFVIGDVAVPQPSVEEAQLVGFGGIGCRAMHGQIHLNRNAMPCNPTKKKVARCKT